MPRIFQIAAGAFAAALAFTSVASFAAGSSDPETDQVKSRVVERLGVRPTTVAKTPFGLWEISVAPDQVFYVDGNVRYLLLGNAVDIATRENLTEKRIAEISRVGWKTLPQKDAIRVVHGSGRYQVAVFADATCMYCRLLESYFAKMNDVTVYTYVFPMKQSRNLAKNVVCAKNPGAAWGNLMTKGVKPAEANCDDSVLDRNTVLSQKIGVAGTPTLIFPDGSRLGGVPSYENLVKALRERNPGK